MDVSCQVILIDDRIPALLALSLVGPVAFAKRHTSDGHKSTEIFRPFFDDRPIGNDAVKFPILPE